MARDIESLRIIPRAFKSASLGQCAIHDGRKSRAGDGFRFVCALCAYFCVRPQADCLLGLERFPDTGSKSKPSKSQFRYKKSGLGHLGRADGLLIIGAKIIKKTQELCVLAYHMRVPSKPIKIVDEAFFIFDVEWPLLACSF